MHLDVTELRDFYYRSHLGRAAQRGLREQVHDLWPDMARLNLVGFGFAVPVLRPYLRAARRVIALMPAGQGVMHWPAEGDNVSVLCHETRWPVAPGSADRIILMHGFECSERPSAVLESCARSLAPGGRVMFILPNRRGLWARRDGTPFAVGRPYSLGQIETQLIAHGFVPQRHRAALFFPPSGRQFWLRSAGVWERAGRAMSSYWAGGALLVEAMRQDDRPARPGLPEAVRRPLKILEGAPQPGSKPA